MFIIYGVSGVIPVLHYFSIQTVAVINNNLLAFTYLSLMGFFYISGGILYAMRIPEKILPGRCDYYFQSHQIFHLLVNLSAFFHYLGLREFARNTSKNQCEII